MIINSVPYCKENVPLFPLLQGKRPFIARKTCKRKTSLNENLNPVISRLVACLKVLKELKLLKKGFFLKNSKKLERYKHQERMKQLSKKQRL